MSKYETSVIEIGPRASEMMKQEILILFGKNAPDELKEYCLLININSINGKVEKDDTLKINDDLYKIIFVGNQVEKNLEDLGHITINFSGDVDNPMPGTLYVENKELPQISEETKIVIE